MGSTCSYCGDYKLDGNRETVYKLSSNGRIEKYLYNYEEWKIIDHDQETSICDKCIISKLKDRKLFIKDMTEDFSMLLPNCSICMSIPENIDDITDRIQIYPKYGYAGNKTLGLFCKIPKDLKVNSSYRQWYCKKHYEEESIHDISNADLPVQYNNKKYV